GFMASPWVGGSGPESDGDGVVIAADVETTCAGRGDALGDHDAEQFAGGLTHDAAGESDLDGARPLVEVGTDDANGRGCHVRRPPEPRALGGRVSGREGLGVPAVDLDPCGQPRALAYADRQE